MKDIIQHITKPIETGGRLNNNKGAILIGQVIHDEKLSKDTTNRDGEDTKIQEAESRH